MTEPEHPQPQSAARLPADPKKYAPLVAAAFSVVAAGFAAGRIILGRRVDRDRR